MSQQLLTESSRIGEVDQEFSSDYLEVFYCCDAIFFAVDFEGGDGGRVGVVSDENVGW